MVLKHVWGRCQLLLAQHSDYCLPPSHQISDSTMKRMPNNFHFKNVRMCLHTPKVLACEQVECFSYCRKVVRNSKCKNQMQKSNAEKGPAELRVSSRYMPLYALIICSLHRKFPQRVGVQTINSRLCQRRHRRVL